MSQLMDTAHACAGGNGKQMFGDAWWLLMDAVPAVGLHADNPPAPTPPPRPKAPVGTDAPSGEQVCTCESPASMLLQQAALPALGYGMTHQCHKLQSAVVFTRSRRYLVLCRYRQFQSGQVLQATSLRLCARPSQTHSQHLHGELQPHQVDRFYHACCAKMRRDGLPVAQLPTMHLTCD